MKTVVMEGHRSMTKVLDVSIQKIIKKSGTFHE